MSWSAHVTVATVIEKDGRFLLVEEHSEGITHPVYNQPAGHVEPGETLLEAAYRETKEETAWEIEITHLLGIYTYTPPMFPNKSFFRFCFLAKPIQDTEQALDTDILRLQWLSLDELQLSARARSPLVIKCIQDALKGQQYPLSLIYEHPFAAQFNSDLEA